MLLDNRAYESFAERIQPGVDPEIHYIMGELRLGVLFLEELFARLEDIPDDETEFEEDLILMVEECARRFATEASLQLSRKHAGAGIANRFLHVARDNDVRNDIYRIPVLKQVFVRVFMEELGLDHNVCFKSHNDPPSPPFTDVVATFLGDMMDRRDGTFPSAVMVNHHN